MTVSHGKNPAGLRKKALRYTVAAIPDGVTIEAVAGAKTIALDMSREELAALVEQAQRVLGDNRLSEAERVRAEAQRQAGKIADIAQHVAEERDAAREQLRQAEEVGRTLRGEISTLQERLVQAELEGKRDREQRDHASTNLEDLRAEFVRRNDERLVVERQLRSTETERNALAHKVARIRGVLAEASVEPRPATYLELQKTLTRGPRSLTGAEMRECLTMARATPRPVRPVSEREVADSINHLAPAYHVGGDDKRIVKDLIERLWMELAEARASLAASRRPPPVESAATPEPSWKCDRCPTLDLATVVCRCVTGAGPWRVSPPVKS